MKRGGKILFAGGIVAALLLLWLIKQEYGRLSARGERLREVQQKAASQRGEAQQLKKTLEVFARSTDSSTAPSTGRTVVPAAPAALPLARPRAPSRPWLTRLFAESPNLHRLYLEAYRSELEFEHALTFEALGLTAAERGGVLGVLARDMERQTDIAAAARGGDLGSANSSIRELHSQRAQETAAALRAVLGEHYEAWLTDRRSRIPFVSDAAMHLHRTTTPLTLAQADELAVMARKGISGRREGNNFVLPTEADYAAFAEEVGRVLSPEQSAVVRGLIEQLSARRQLDQAQSAKRK